MRVVMGDDGEVQLCRERGEVEMRLVRSASRLETLISRMEATARMECDCNLASLRRENERLLFPA